MSGFYLIRNLKKLDLANQGQGVGPFDDFFVSIVQWRAFLKFNEIWQVFLLCTALVLKSFDVGMFIFGHFILCSKVQKKEEVQTFRPGLSF